MPQKVNTRTKRYIQTFLCVVATLVIGTTMLLNSPRVQQQVSVIIASELENHIGTRVELGGVHWLFPNDIVIDSLAIDDQEGEKLLAVKRIAAKLEWKPLIKHGLLSIRNIRIFYPEVNVYKETAEAEANYQFLIDAFATKKKQEQPTKLNLRINSLLVRHADINYDILDKEKQVDTFTPHHIDIDDLSTHMSLKTITNDTISLMVRALNFREKSGMKVDDLYFRFVGNHYGATLANFHLELPYTSIELDTLWVSYTPDNFTESLTVKGAILPSYAAAQDFSFLSPEINGIQERIKLSAQFDGSLQEFKVRDIALQGYHYDVALKAEATANLKEWTSSVIDLDIQEAIWGKQTWNTLEKQLPAVYEKIPEEVIRIGKVEVKGEAHISKDDNILHLSADTDAGEINANLSIDSLGKYYANIKGTQINVAQIIPTSPLEQTDITLRIDGKYTPQNTNKEFPLQGNLVGTACNTTLLGYQYQTIKFESDYSPTKITGEIKVDDPNANLELKVGYKDGKHDYNIDLKADSLNLHAMNLIDIHEGKSFSIVLNGHADGKDLDHLVGKVEVKDLTMHDNGDDYKISNISLISSQIEQKELMIDSDFLGTNIRGVFTYHDLIECFSSHLYHYLPALDKTPHQCPQTETPHGYISLKLKQAQPLQKFLLLPIDFKKEITAEANFSKFKELSYNIKVEVPQLEYNGNSFEDGHIVYETLDSCLSLNAKATKLEADNTSFSAEISAQAVDDNINLTLEWNSKPEKLFAGKLCTTANLWHTADNNLAIQIKSDNVSTTTLKHSEWTLRPFELYITPQYATIRDFHFENDKTQHINIDGTIAQSPTDTLNIKFNDVDLSYLLSFVKLNGLSFDAQMSGHIDAAALYSPKPYIDAQIDAKDFTFCKGNLGDAKIYAQWEQDSTRLEFTADINETPEHTTNIDGLLDIANNELWLDIKADSTNLSFLNELLKSFMGEIKGNASGNLLLGGKLDSLDLCKGALLANTDFRLTPTNTYYSFNDSLRFEPGKIILRDIKLKDRNDKEAYVNGAITHSRINDFAYKLKIKAWNILGIDLPDTGNNSFYTTIYGTGDIEVSGAPRQPLQINIDADPEAESVFALNLAGQDVTSSEAFLTYRDRNSTRNSISHSPLEQTTRVRRNNAEEVTPLHLNINTNVTPKAKLKLVMDQSTDDHISVTGNGELDIKIIDDDINLFGLYTVDRGSYNFSLQDLINKKFDVLQGGYVKFNGDPLTAELNITARHIIPQASMKNLSPELTSQVQANCLLHIRGSLNAPTLSFEVELPKATEEEKSILRSYTSTEEQKNLQFIYLLSTGSFYTQDIAQNGQNTGMESLVSNTISGQISNLMSLIIDNDNWNFSSAIRRDNLLGENTTDNTWDNMEFKGILEGRMFNNRLLINGNLGYRDNPIYTSNFIGDFDLQYLLTNELSIKGYSKTNDRYFTKTALTTQGVGLLFQRDFNYIFKRDKKKKKDKYKDK